MSKDEVPKALDAIVDKVLAYRPKPKTKGAKKRKRKTKKLLKTALLASYSAKNDQATK